MMKAALALCVTAFFCWGCAATMPGACDDWLDTYHRHVGGVDFLQQGGVTYAGVSMCEDTPREALSNCIYKALKRPWEPSAKWPYDNMALLQPPIREREFWAFVLAELEGKEFSVRTHESTEDRDSNVTELVNAIRQTTRHLE